MLRGFFQYRVKNEIESYSSDRYAKKTDLFLWKIIKAISVDLISLE